MSSKFPDDPIAPKNHNFSNRQEFEKNFISQQQKESSYVTSYTKNNNTWYVYAEKLLARAEPSSSANVITALKFQQLVEIVEVTNSIWCKTKFTYFDSTESRFKTVNAYIEKAFLSEKYPEVSLPPKENINLTMASSRSNTIINSPIFPSRNNEVKTKSILFNNYQNKSPAICEAS